MLLFLSQLCILSYFRVFVGSNNKVSNKVLFGAFWSIFGPRLDSASMETWGWTFLKIRRLEISMCVCKCVDLQLQTSIHYTHYIHSLPNIHPLHPLHPLITKHPPTTPITSTHYQTLIHYTHYIHSLPNIHPLHPLHPLITKHSPTTPITSTHYHNIHHYHLN